MKPTIKINPENGVEMFSRKCLIMQFYEAYSHVYCVRYWRIWTSKLVKTVDVPAVADQYNQQCNLASGDGRRNSSIIQTCCFTEKNVTEEHSDWLDNVKHYMTNQTTPLLRSFWEMASGDLPTMQYWCGYTKTLKSTKYKFQMDK